MPVACECPLTSFTASPMSAYSLDSLIPSPSHSIAFFLLLIPLLLRLLSFSGPNPQPRLSYNLIASIFKITDPFNSFLARVSVTNYLYSVNRWKIVIHIHTLAVHLSILSFSESLQPTFLKDLLSFCTPTILAIIPKFDYRKLAISRFCRLKRMSPQYTGRLIRVDIWLYIRMYLNT